MFMSSTNIQISWRESGNTLGDIPKERERKGDRKKKKEDIKTLSGTRRPEGSTES